MLRVKALGRIHRRRDVSRKNQPAGIVEKGTILEVEGPLRGEKIDGKSEWYRDRAGFYYWGGALRVESLGLLADERVGWGLKKLKIPNIWAYGRGNGSRVAVLDTGIQTDHPEFAGAITAAKDFVDRTAVMTDHDGHGTHCAGIIAARGIGRMIGIASECKLLIGKIMNTMQDGFADETLAEAIEWAVSNRADVISLSVYNPKPLPLTEAAIAEAVLVHKIAVVAAIGNKKAVPGFRPAIFSNCISVGALDDKLELADYTSRFQELTITAPGEKILSTTKHFDPGEFINEGYVEMSGTSMAAPFISGLVAILKANNKKADPALIKNAIANTGDLKMSAGYSYKVINPKNLFRSLTS